MSAAKKKRRKAISCPPRANTVSLPLSLHGATRSALPPETLRAMRARRLGRERDAAMKLALLRRLERQKVLRDLPETRVEQSFNEQLFARILGYRTLLSHEPGAFNLLPKNAIAAKKFDDFSLGFFRPDGTSEVVATAEFKSPGADLDRRQTGGSYGQLSPVDQTFAAAAAHPTCRWCLVSNFRELRLYAIDGPMLGRLIASTDLLAVRTRDDLAILGAHFDSRALLGDDAGKERPEMDLALSTSSPLAAFQKEDGYHRTNWLYTPMIDVPMPMHVIEPRLRKAVESAPSLERYIKPLQPHPVVKPERVAIDTREGWLVIEGEQTHRLGVLRTRIAVSRFGQVSLAVQEPKEPGPGHTYRYIQKEVLEDEGFFFAAIVEGVHHKEAVSGALDVAIRDVDGFQWKHEIRNAKTDCVDALDIPVSTKADAATLGRALATAIAELAIHFRDDRGGVVLDAEQQRQAYVSHLRGQGVHG